MKKKTEFPSWFNHYSRPHKPDEPSEKNKVQGEVVKKLSIYDGETILPEDGLCMSFERNRGYDDYSDEYYILYSKPETTIDNPKYEKQLDKYNKDIEEYNVRIKQWHKYKKIYDEEKDMEYKEHRRKQFEALKKEFGE